MIHTRKPN
jgi:hypothetical protein